MFQRACTIRKIHDILIANITDDPIKLVDLVAAVKKELPHILDLDIVKCINYLRIHKKVMRTSPDFSDDRYTRY